MDTHTERERERERDYHIRLSVMHYFQWGNVSFNLITKQ